MDGWLIMDARGGVQKKWGGGWAGGDARTCPAAEVDGGVPLRGGRARVVLEDGVEELAGVRRAGGGVPGGVEGRFAEGGHGRGRLSKYPVGDAVVSASVKGGLYPVAGGLWI